MSVEIQNYLLPWYDVKVVTKAYTYLSVCLYNLVGMSLEAHCQGLWSVSVFSFINRFIHSQVVYNINIKRETQLSRWKQSKDIFRVYHREGNKDQGVWLLERELTFIGTPWTIHHTLWKDRKKQQKRVICKKANTIKPHPVRVP